MNVREYIEAQRKLHDRMTFQGLNISIENRAGSTRRGVDSDGNEWATKMKVPYGYIRKTEASDGEHVDCFVGPNENADKAYVIHIKDPVTGAYDEDKCFLGFNSEAEAKQCFNDHYDNPEKFYKGMTTMSMEDFKAFVLDKENHGEKIAAGAIQWAKR